jgi:hypothetical protein
MLKPEGAVGFVIGPVVVNPELKPWFCVNIPNAHRSNNHYSDENYDPFFHKHERQLLKLLYVINLSIITKARATTTTMHPTTSIADQYRRLYFGHRIPKVEYHSANPSKTPGALKVLSQFRQTILFDNRRCRGMTVYSVCVLSPYKDILLAVEHVHQVSDLPLPAGQLRKVLGVLIRVAGSIPSFEKDDPQGLELLPLDLGIDMP